LKTSYKKLIIYGLITGIFLTVILDLKTLKDGSITMPIIALSMDGDSIGDFVPSLDDYQWINTYDFPYYGLSAGYSDNTLLVYTLRDGKLLDAISLSSKYALDATNLPNRLDDLSLPSSISKNDIKILYTPNNIFVSKRYLIQNNFIKLLK
jgi:hypothetical protein